MNTEEPIKKKRGRKKKSEIEAELALDPTPVVEPTGKKRGRNIFRMKPNQFVIFRWML